MSTSLQLPVCEFLGQLLVKLPKCISSQILSLQILHTYHIKFQCLAAEIRTAIMLAEHNVALLTADHLGQLYRVNFPDSAIAEGYQSARTKTSCILKYAIAPELLGRNIKFCCFVQQQ